MIRRLREMFSPRTQERPPLALTRRELTATRPTFVRHVAEADRVLADFARMDGVVKLVVVRPR